MVNRVRYLTTKAHNYQTARFVHIVCFYPGQLKLMKLKVMKLTDILNSELCLVLLERNLNELPVFEQVWPRTKLNFCVYRSIGEILGIRSGSVVNLTEKWFM